MTRIYYFKQAVPFALILSLIVFSNKAIAQDNCASAITLSSSTGCNNTSINLSTATASTGIPVGCWTAGTYYDFWYQFTATSTSHTITLSNIGNRITNPRIQIYSGTCGSLTSVVCGNTSGTPVTATATGLAIGNIYYVRVAQMGAFGGTGNYRADICVTNPVPPPANDDCSGATSLTPGTSCTNTASTLYYATPSSGVIPSGCSISGTVYEVWFRFTATATTQLVALSSLGTGLSGASTYVQMFSSSNGLCSGTLTSLGCSAASSSLSVSSLTVGTTYYIRVFVQTNPVGVSSSVYSFNICVTQPPAAPANDDCAGSVLLTSALSCNNTTSSLFYATTSTGIPAGCVAGPLYEVWFRYVATATSQIITLSSLGSSLSNASTYVQMFSSSNGLCGGTLTSLGCSAASSALTVSGLTIGTTYYIRVFTQTNPTGTNSAAYGFNICVQQLGGNDLCANAIDLISNTTCNTISGTLQGATYTAPTVAFSCGGATSADVWYKFVAQTPNPTITFNYVSWGGGVQRILQLFQPGTCGSLTSIGCYSNTSSISTTGLTVG
jgi:hypothetical protein